jgi:outer membrane lipoprotein LolB
MQWSAWTPVPPSKLSPLSPLYARSQRVFARAFAVAALLLLTACATQPLVIDDPDWLRHQASVATVQDWELTGRLVVRQNGDADSVNINWMQQSDSFDLRLFGSLGLGAVRVYGLPTRVTVERGNDEPVTLPGLGAVTQEYFGYDFPTAELLYWIRGLPAPDLRGSNTFDANRMLATLQQVDTNGVAWMLNFENYLPLEGAAALPLESAAGTIYLPGRIIAQREGLELRFLVSGWKVPQRAAQNQAGQ